jgi:hypothetical protein
VRTHAAGHQQTFGDAAAQRSFRTELEPLAAFETYDTGHSPAALYLIQWRANAASALVEDVRVDHRRRDIRVAEQLLHRPNVIAGLQQVRRKRVPAISSAR